MPRFLSAFCLLVCVAFAAEGQESRAWTDVRGRTFNAKLVAADAVRATLDIEGRGKVAAPLTALSPADQEFIRRWRAGDPRAPLVDPAALAPWQPQVAVAPMAVQVVEDKPATRSFIWESPHFRLSSDQKLPTAVVREIAIVGEATRELLLQLPLGLHLGGESKKYIVRMFQRPVDYRVHRGGAGSAVNFNGEELLILLPNFGLKPSSNGLAAEHAQPLLELKHEYTEQLLAAMEWKLPVWLQEGLAECVASWPYAQGRYLLQNSDAALRDHLTKWRKPAERKPFRVVSPEKLMALTTDEWRTQVAEQESFDLLNSATLLTHYWLFHAGKGDGAALAAYLHSLRGGTEPSAAEAQHLLAGRSRADLASEVQKLARKLNLEVTLE